MQSVRCDLTILFVGLGLLAGGCGDDASRAFPDAGPPIVEFAYGDKYPDPQIVGLNGILIPSNDAFPATWILFRVIARREPAGYESLENLSATIRVLSEDDASLIAESSAPMIAIFEDSSSQNIAWSDVSFDICADARTKDGASLVVEATVTRDGSVFVEAESGAQRISCEGNADCLAVCGSE